MAFSNDDPNNPYFQNIFQQMMQQINSNIESQIQHTIQEHLPKIINSTSSDISSATIPNISYDNKKIDKNEEDLIKGQILHKYSKRDLLLQSMIDKNDELDKVEDERAKMKKEKRDLRTKILTREKHINYYQIKKRQDRELKRLKDTKKAERDKNRLRNLNFLLKEKKIQQKQVEIPESDEEMEEDLR